MERFAGQPEPIGHGGASGGRYSHDAIVYRVPLCGFHGRMHMRKLILEAKKFVICELTRRIDSWRLLLSALSFSGACCVLVLNGF
jgi:hypothetical protein